jgi:hypothetical protein
VGGQVMTTTRSLSWRSAAQGATSVSSYGRHTTREHPQEALAASLPPPEPPEQPHIEGEAVAEGIDGGGALGFGDRRRRASFLGFQVKGLE